MSTVAPGGSRGEAPGAVEGPRAARRARPALGLEPAWWPVAHSEEVARHPRAFRVGTRDLAVYRDLGGVVRAVDDSCPHRRLPLSMGRITQDGYLQCPYHGWCFDGASGRCTQIPNLHETEKVPAGIRVAAFTTAESIADLLGFGLRTEMLAPRVGPPTGEEPDEGTAMFDALVVDGFVLVWSGGDDPAPGSRPRARASAAGPDLSGRIEVRAPHERVAEALLLNPGGALGLAALIGAGEELCDPDVRVHGDAVSVRRDRVARALPRVSTFESLSRRVVTSTTTMLAATGLASIEVAGEGRWPTTRVIVGLTPIGPYRTVVRWRAHLDGGVPGQVPLIRALATARRLAGRAPDGLEAIADAAPQIVDAGLHALRDARDASRQDPTERGST